MGQVVHLRSEFARSETQTIAPAPVNPERLAAVVGGAGLLITFWGAVVILAMRLVS